jgi:hypothetical protein
MTWRDALERYQGGDAALFDETFLAQRADTPWQPTDEDKTAAAKLHIQLVSRITTQSLGYLDGDEKTALTSVYRLFDETRTIATAHPGGRHFDAVAWHVLNTHVRPFTAKWHGKSQRGALDALDATDEFRAELAVLRPVLQQLDHLLTFIRDGEAPSVTRPRKTAPTQLPLTDELKEEIAGGINFRFSGFKDGFQVHAINDAERKAIDAHRRQYPQVCVDPATPYVTGLALSGGGIRSATFALGVLVALAQRDLLPQFDYLSTVSGGGYLGSFLSAFLQSPTKKVGLSSGELPFQREEGEAAALRHIRHHSKYLAVGGIAERLGMLSAQLYGVALNFLAMLWMATLVVVTERAVRDIFTGSATALGLSLVLLGVGAALSLLALRVADAYQRVTDWHTRRPPLGS